MQFTSNKAVSTHSILVRNSELWVQISNCFIYKRKVKGMIFFYEQDHDCELGS